MSKTLLLAALLLAGASRGAGAADFSSAANGTSAAQFLTLGGDARAAAMGEAFTAVTDDASAVYYNPAALTRVDDSAFSFMHLVGLQSTFLDNASYAYRLDDANAAGISVLYMNYGSIGETDTSGNSIGTAHPYDLAATGAFSHQFHDVGELLNGGSLGLSVSYIESQIVDSANTLTGSLGFLSRPYGFDRLRVSLVAADIFGGLKFDQATDPLPTTIKLGASAYPVPWLLTSAEADFPRASSPYVALGIEHWFGNPFETGLALRAGLNTSTLGSLGGLSGFAAGFGIAFASMRLDYAFVPFGELGWTNRVSLSFRFGGDDTIAPHRTHREAAPAAAASAPMMTAPDIAPTSEDTYATHLQMARGFESISQHAKAIPEYRLAIAAKPLDATAHLELAKILTAKPDLAAAASEWLAADALLPKGDPQRAYCRERLGALEVKRGDLDKARSYYERAIEFAQDHSLTGSSTINSYLGAAYVLSEQGHKDSAIADYQKAFSLSANPQTKEAIRLRILQLRGRLKADDGGN